MSSKGKRIFDQVLGIFDKSPTMKHPRNLIHLGLMEETDVLGVSLHKEAQFGSRKSLKRVIKTAICIDYPNDCAQTPLFCACARGNEQTALLLLEYGANPNEKSQNGMTPCHAACYIGNVRLLGKLIEAGGDMRLHDNDGNGVKEWTLLNPDPRKRAKLLDFLNRTYVYAMAYSGDSVNNDKLSEYVHRPYKQTSLMEIMKMRTGSDSSFENLKRVQSMGFGKVYLGNDRHGGIISVIPLISEAALFVSDSIRYDTGYATYMEEMEWMNVPVSLKQVKPDVNVEDGIDLLIAEAEYIGKLRHPNILLLMGICQSTQLDRLMLVFERVEKGTLHYFLHFTDGMLGNNEKMDIIWHVCGAMDFIHNQSLMHCGLSSYAIYLVSPQLIKVGNFEFMVESIKADLGKPSQVSLTSHGKFLYNWMAPELIKGQVPHYSSDVYSFSCIVWEIFAGEVPWNGLTPLEIKQKVVKERETLSLSLSFLPSKLKAIVGYGLELTEADRLNKFSIIINWLKSEKVPKFQRTHGSLVSLQSRNKSANNMDQMFPSCPKAYSCTGTDSPVTSSCSKELLDLMVARSTSSSTKNASLAGEAESDVNSTISLYGSSHSCGSSPSLKPGTNFYGSSTGCFDFSSLMKESPQQRKTLSESSLQRREEPPQSIKPASHVAQLRCEGAQRSHYNVFSLYGRNNNGKPFEVGKSSSMPQDPSSRTKSEKHPCIDTLDLVENCTRSFHVRELAKNFQDHLNQHKKRQAILKGSMTLRGTCLELEGSNEIGRKTQQGCVDCSDNKTIHETEAMLILDTADLSSTPLLQNSSTPQPTLPETVTSKPSAGKRISDRMLHQMFHSAMSSTKEEGTSWKEVEDCPGNDIRSWEGDDVIDDEQVFDDDQENKISQNIADTYKEEISNNKSHLNGCESHCDRHSSFLEEIIQTHARIYQQSMNSLGTESPPNCQHHSPTITVDLLNGKTPDCDFSLLAKSQLLDGNENLMYLKKESDCALVSSSPHSQYPIFPQAGYKTGMLSQQPVFNVESSTKDDSFWGIASDVTQDKGTVVNLKWEDPQDTQTDCSLQNLGKCADIWKIVDCSALDVSEKEKQEAGVSDSIRCQTTDEMMNGCQGKKWEDEIEPVASPDVSSKQSIYSDDEDFTGAALEDEETVEEELNGTLTIAGKSQSSKMNTCLDTDDTLTQQCVSVDSMKLGQWVDLELETIREKMSHMHCKAADTDKGVSSSDVNSKPTSCDSTNKQSDKSTSAAELLKIESAKSVSEVDGCDFEFQEFFIDDDFESTEHIQQYAPRSKLPLCDCNISTRHPIDTGVFRLEAASVKEKAAFFTSKMISVKPPVFPCWPKMIRESTHVTNKDISQSALTSDTDSVEKLQAKTLQGSISDKVISKTGEVGSCLLKGITSSKSSNEQQGRDGVHSLFKPVAPGSSLQSGHSEPCVRVASVTGEMESKRANQIDEGATFQQGIAEATVDLDLDESTGVSNDENIVCVEGGSGKETCDSCIRHYHSSGKTKDGGSSMPSVAADNKQTGMFASQACQTTHTKKMFRAGPVYDSDSDSIESDQWVKSRLQAIQSKIRRRKAREHYDQSSEEETTWNDDLLDSEGGMESRVTADLQAGRSCKILPTKSETCSFQHIGKKENNNKGSKSSTGQLSSTHVCKHVRAQKSLCSSESHCGSHSRTHIQRKEETEGSFPYHKDSIPKVTTRKQIKHSVSCASGVASKTKNAGFALDARRADKTLPTWKLQKSDEKSKASDLELDIGKGCEKRGKSSRTTSLPSMPRLSNSSIVSHKSPFSLPRSKHSSSILSRSEDRVISFQDNSDTESSKTKKVMYKSSKHYQLQPEEITMGSHETESFVDSTDCVDDRIVKTWLEKQDFAERNSLISFKPEDHENIPSRPMDSQRMTFRCKAAYDVMPKQSLYSCNDTVDAVSTSQDSIPFQRGNSSQFQQKLVEGHHHSLPEMGQKVKSPFATDCKKSVSLCETEESWPNDHSEKGYDDCHSKAKRPSHRAISQSFKKDQTLADDHCLSLDLISTSTNGEGIPSPADKRKEKAQLGLHRFYIPREMWSNGCQARLHIQISPTHPNCQRVTTIATNPTNGQTETLLDQCIASTKLRSTMQID